ncbi:hypothetical protein JCM10213_005775 [Rhodosporidiobolus nylandii]
MPFGNSRVTAYPPPAPLDEELASDAPEEPEGEPAGGASQQGEEAQVDEQREETEEVVNETTGTKREDGMKSSEEPHAEQEPQAGKAPVREDEAQEKAPVTMKPAAKERTTVHRNTVPLIFPEASWLGNNRFAALHNEEGEKDDPAVNSREQQEKKAIQPEEPTRAEPKEAQPVKPKPQQKRRTNARMFRKDPPPEPNLEETIKKASDGLNFKHRVWVKGPEVEVAQAVAIVDDGAEVNLVDAEWFESWRDDLGLVLEEDPNDFGIRTATNTVQKGPGRTRIRVQMGTLETEVVAKVINSNGAFQLLLGKPWKAAAEVVHFYEVDCMMHPTTVPGKWATLWNENPKAAPSFKSIPADPATLSRFLEDGKTCPTILLASKKTLSTLEQAMMTPIPEDDGLLDLPRHGRVLRMTALGDKDAPDSPAGMSLLLEKEEWQRQLALHPRNDLFFGEAEGSAFLSQDEIERVMRRLEQKAKESLSSFWDSEESLADFWGNVDNASSEDWEKWKTRTLPRLDPEWLIPLPSERKQQAKLHVYLTTKGDDDGEDGEGAGEPSIRERIAELRRVLKVGDEKVNLSKEEEKQVYDLCEEFIDQFAFSLKDVKQTQTVELRIPTSGATPTRARYRPVNNEDQRKFLHEMVQQLLDADIIFHVAPDDVTWVSHNKVAPKASHSTQNLSTDQLLQLLDQTIKGISPEKDGWVTQRLDELPKEAKLNKKFRLCHAFLDLNDATMGAPFPVGDLEGKIARLSGKKIFSCFDLHSGYFAIPIREEDQLKTTFGVEDMGYFAYKRMPFGLKGAPAAFCELIAKAFAPYLGKTIEAWMDDLATSTNTFEEHLANVRTILETCREHNLSLNPAKCQLFTSGMVWCGNYLSEKGRQPDKAKVQAVVEWPEPENALKVLQFLNFAGYYRPLIKDYAKMTEPLAQVTRGVKLPPKRRYGKNGGVSKGAYRAALQAAKVEWNDERRQAFFAVKTALTSFPVLQSPNWSLPFQVETDASIRGMGAVLSQEFSYVHPESGKAVVRRHPVAYASRATKEPEKRYSAFLLELVCVKWALEKFQKYIFGRPLQLVTDCEALAGILSLQSVSAAHTRWREYILSHDIVKFTHRPGKANTAADELSRRRDNPVEEGDTTPDCTLPEDWQEYRERNPIPAALLLGKAKVPLDPHCLDEAEAAFFLQREERESSLRARFSGDEDFEALGEFLLSLKIPPALSAAEAGG